MSEAAPFGELRNAQGERLDYACAGGAGPGEDLLVVLCHGVTANKDRAWATTLAQELTDAGFASLRAMSPAAVMPDYDPRLPGGDGGSIGLENMGAGAWGTSGMAVSTLDLAWPYGLVIDFDVAVTAFDAVWAAANADWQATAFDAAGGLIGRTVLKPSGTKLFLRLPVKDRLVFTGDAVERRLKTLASVLGYAGAGYGKLPET